MAAPTPTARGTPDGIKMKDGYQSFYVLENAPTLAVWEKTTKSPGLDGGDKIDTTTMHNETLRTFHPRSLITLMDGSFTGAYDPAVLDELLAQLNIPQAITKTFSDGASWTFYGFFQKFEVGEDKEGEMPETTMTVVATNVDPDTDEEELPVYTPAGTGS